MPNFWTDDEKRIVAAQLRQGATASEISSLFRHHTRNSVVGVVHRDKALKAIGFKTPARGGSFAANQSAGKKPGTAPAPPPFKPENRFNLAVKGGIRASQKPTGENPTKKLQIPCTPPPPAPPIEAIGIPLVEIRDGQCRWPLWPEDMGDHSFPMCGAATKIDKHYCQGHRAKAETARAR